MKPTPLTTSPATPSELEPPDAETLQNRLLAAELAAKDAEQQLKMHANANAELLADNKALQVQHESLQARVAQLSQAWRTLSKHLG